MADTVKDYMVPREKVRFVTPDMTVEEVRQALIGSSFHGFPIVENDYLLGFVTAKDLLRYMDRPNERIRNVIRSGSFCATPSMSISDATRILFRYGIRNLPVVDESTKKVVGIISNIDVVRSHIEKTRQSKVESVKAFLEKYNDVKIRVMPGIAKVPIEEVIPTQKEVYLDELAGRQYELKRGLNEPLIMIKRRNGYLLVDGHHRVMAAKELGYKELRATVLVPNDLDVKLGLEKTAERWGLKSLDDVIIKNDAKHPFMEAATMLLPSEQADGINQRLMESENN
ncbi:MAG: CBS domain-containing protein [Candidatus Methanomethylophilaceae archaeon]|nr:CBS domain-containing protein [Candidatus Methanomethylophilaceae archaeon]